MQLYIDKWCCGIISSDTDKVLGLNELSTVSQEIKIVLKNKMVLPTYLPYFFYVPFLVNSTHKVSFLKKIYHAPFQS